MERDTVGEIKERLNVQEVIGAHVKLHRAGKSIVGLCPFHKEKTPSFHVSPERGTWHCFGCGEGGDIFSFVEKIDGVDFKTALKMLAEKAGVPIQSNRGEGDEAASKKERLREAMNRAGQWYAEKLSGSAADAYAKGRGLSDDTIRNWGIGFAPEGWRGLLEALSAEGFTTTELLSAGLIKEADGKPGTYYDRFRNRLMFPIRDLAGRVVAFTGRALSADEQAKYLNSPETVLYHKSEILYGMDRAKDAIRTRGFTLLVEGQMDVLMAHQAGFENAIALSGTALSEKHLALMKRYSENLMLVLDADAAGLSATAKSAHLALREGLRVKAVRLPKGKDPADLIREPETGAKDFAERVRAAKPIVEFFLAVLSENESDPHRLLRTAESVVLPLIAAMKSPMEREHFSQVAGRTLGLSAEAVRESLGRLPKEPITSAVAKPSLSQGVKLISTRQVREAQLLAIYRAYPSTPLASRVETEYARITGVQVPPESLPESALFQAEQLFGESPKEDAADELLHAFESAVIREAYQGAVADLRRAEAAGDAVAIVRAQERCSQLSVELARLGK